MAADRHLLFGLLALQTGVIQQAQLVAAFHAWTCDKSRSLAGVPVQPASHGPGKRDKSDIAKAGKLAATPYHQKRTCPAFSNRVRRP